jgi:hypothetical protein
MIASSLVSTYPTLQTRIALPYLVPEGRTFSVWEILKEAVGKDITKISMPVLLNEPISMLQKVSEIMCNHYLMNKAIQARDDHLKRMAYIAAFNIT